MHAYIVRMGESIKSFSRIIQNISEKNYPYSWCDDFESLSRILDNNKNEKGVIIISSTVNLSSTILSIEKLIPILPPDMHIFCIVDKVTPTDYKTLSRTGKADLTDWASAANEISEYLQELNKNLEKNNDKSNIETNDHSPYVASFIGTSGGAGNTTIAMEIGIELAQRKHAQGQKINSGIAFLDLDFSNSAGVCDYLNLDPRLAIAEIATNPRRLDSYMLQMMASKHSSGLDFFCSKNDPYLSSTIPSKAILLSLLNCLVDNYSILLIDIPNRCNFDIAEIVNNSDMVMCTGLLSVVSTKNTKFMLRYLDSIGVKKSSTAVIATDVDTNLIGKISPRFDLQKIFPDRKIHYIRRDRLFALECADAGVSMVQSGPTKGISQDIKAIASSIEENKTNNNTDRDGVSGK